VLKSPTQSRAARGVVEHLVRGGVEPGMHINELAIAQRLGISRTPVRAALEHLREEGILEHRQGEGFFLIRPLASVEEAGLTDAAGEELYERILRDILEGNLDSTMSHNALIRRYGVRRGDVNAALRRMVREGLAEPAFGHGWTFVQFSRDIVRKGYRLRMLLEPSILTESDYRVDTEALERLDAAHARIVERLDERMGRKTISWNELFDLDARFHETLAAGGGNELYVEIVRKQNRIRRLNEILGYERVERVRQSLNEHRGILDSLLHGDHESAGLQMRRHLRRSLDQSLRHCDQDIEDFRAGRRRFTRKVEGDPRPRSSGGPR